MMKGSLALGSMLLCAATLHAQEKAEHAQPDQPNGQTVAQPAQSEQMRQMRAQLADWANLERYRAENARMAPPAPDEQRVVFLGDSITDFWGHTDPTDSFFPGKPYVNRGISGQTTPQMLVRFQPDVVQLHPAVVVILSGTNDIAGNTGPATPEMIEDNWMSMAAIAEQAGIKVVFASITPAFSYPWQPGVHPSDEIRKLNDWLGAYCKKSGYIYLDYYGAMADSDGAMRPGLSRDGVHPTKSGYSVMMPLAEHAIALALAGK